MVRCICCMFFNNSRFLLGSWKTLKTYLVALLILIGKLSKIILKDENVTELWKKLQKEILFKYCVIKIYNISEKLLPNLLLKFLSFPKINRENHGNFHNPHEQGYWKMSKFFSIIFQEDEKFQKQAGQSNFQISCIFPRQSIQIISTSPISFITQSNFYL